LSVKTIVKSHFSSFPITEHFKKHKTFFSDRNQVEFFPKYFGEVEMRRFTLQDLDGCVDLYKEVFSADPWYDDWLSNEQVRHYLKELIANPVFEGFVAYESSDIIAVCLGHKRSWWNGKEFFIDELFVAKNMQEKGIGTQLLNYVESNPLIDDCVRLILLTNSNFPAEKFYLKRGFKINKNRIIMVKNFI
jgi:aminoglycoside 6'-N-acetyltransferase I